MSNSTFVSEVSICNQALGWLGADPITSLDDDNTTAELCKLNYPHLRDSVLTEVAWTFATTRAKSTTADRDAWDERFVHAIPAEWLQVLRVFWRVTENDKDTSVGWVREGTNILARHSTVYLWGIQPVTDTSQFSAAFVQCLAARIAADLCIAITQNQTQQGVLWQLYGAKIKEAASAEGVQGANELIRSNTLIDARARTF